MFGVKKKLVNWFHSVKKRWVNESAVIWTKSCIQQQTRRAQFQGYFAFKSEYLLLFTEERSSEEEEEQNLEKRSPNCGEQRRKSIIRLLFFGCVGGYICVVFKVRIKTSGLVLTLRCFSGFPLQGRFSYLSSPLSLCYESF